MCNQYTRPRSLLKSHHTFWRLRKWSMRTHRKLVYPRDTCLAEQTCGSLLWKWLTQDPLPRLLFGVHQSAFIRDWTLMTTWWWQEEFGDLVTTVAGTHLRSDWLKVDPNPSNVFQVNAHHHCHPWKRFPTEHGVDHSDCGRMQWVCVCPWRPGGTLELQWKEADE